MKIIFLEKSYIKCGGETIHRPYSKKWKLSISLEKYSNVLCSFFIVCPSQGLSKYVKIKLQTTCFYFISSFLKKTKRGLELFPLPHFLQDFWRRIFLKLYSINWPDLIVWLSFFHEILGNICIVIACFQGCDVVNLEIDLIFLINLVSKIIKNARTKFFLRNEKCFWDEIKNNFIIFKGISNN